MATASDSMNDKGEQVIAATLRPDGTLRKERRVRAGYVSPDEVPRYVPRQIRVRIHNSYGNDYHFNFCFPTVVVVVFFC